MAELTIVQLDRGSIGPGVILRKPGFAHEWISYDATPQAEVIPRLANADIAVVNKIELDAATIKQLPGLKMIAISATGFDKIDIDACRRAGIVVSNIRGYAKHTVPEHTFALMLALRRGLKGYISDLQQGLWQASPHFCLFTQPVADLHGATLGVIGNGVIGGHVARIAEAFGMTVLKSGRKEAASVLDGYTAFDEVIRRSDVITLHCPLTPETRDLIAEAEFKQMKPTSLIINTSRGGLINEADLIHALINKQIAGAGVDVVSSEPPPADHIFVKHADLPNFILTPHTGWASNEAMQVLWDQLVGHIDQFAAGTPSNNLCES